MEKEEKKDEEIIETPEEKPVKIEKLSRTMKSVIEEAIKKLPPEKAWNENEILFEITNYFVDKFPGDTLEYQLKRMGMETNLKIKAAIELYMTRYANTK